LAVRKVSSSRKNGKKRVKIGIKSVKKHDLSLLKGIGEIESAGVLS